MNTSRHFFNSLVPYETLPHVAYYVLERLEEEYVRGKVKNVRKELGNILNIDFKVLDTLGNFSNKPDAKIGRHASRVQTPITNSENRWMEEVIFRLVKRVGEVNAGVTPLSLIDMNSFPPI